MGFTEAVKSFYVRFFDFSTRSTRSEYWWVFLFYMLGLILLILPFISSVGFENFMNDTVDDDAGGLSLILLGLFFLVNIIPMIALIVRRLHDQDKSGWMYLINFIPYVGGLIMLVFMCLPGTIGSNRFGEDPLDGGLDVFD